MKSFNNTSQCSQLESLVTLDTIVVQLLENTIFLDIGGTSLHKNCSQPKLLGEPFQ